MLKIAPYQQETEKLFNYLQKNNSCVLSKAWSTKVFRLVAVLLRRQNGGSSMPYCDARRLLAAVPILPTNQTLETAFFLAFPFLLIN
jgi:hypothetical protein